MFYRHSVRLLVTVIFLLAVPQRLLAADLDPTAFFFYDGELLGSRNIQIGDPQDWNTVLEGLSGTTASEKLTVSPASYAGENDAIHASWSKAKSKGQFAIYGPEVDLTTYEDIAALAMELEIGKLSKSPIMLGLDCNYPCRSERDVRGMLKKYPRNEWFTFVVPLNCFTLNESASGFDIAKVNGPLLISTEGSMEMSIANVRLVLLPEGDPGCKQ